MRANIYRNVHCRIIGLLISLLFVAGIGCSGIRERSSDDDSSDLTNTGESGGGGGGETGCEPGHLQCANDRVVEACGSNGSSYSEVETCADTAFCSDGSCLTYCDSAELRSSYDGCRFFAVDLPQFTTDIVAQGVSDHPFAVVIANPHDETPTHITITDHTRAPVELIAEQTVVDYREGSGGSPPRTTIVYSEIRDAQGVVTRISGAADAVELSPGGMATFILPDNNAGMSSAVGVAAYQNELAAKAYRIESDMPVIAYQFSPICCSQSYSNDASILFPVGSYGTHYVGVSLPHWFTYPGFVAVVAGDEEADVTIDVGDRPFSALDGVTVDGAVLAAKLEPYDVLTLLSSQGAGSDLTGIDIRATADVAVFGGHACSFVPQNYSACDHLETALMPVDSWRQQYIGAHSHWRSERATEVNYYRIVAGSTDARITTDPGFDTLITQSQYGQSCQALLSEETDTLWLAAGSFCDFGTRDSFLMSGDVPFQLVQLIVGAEATGAGPAAMGDPAMTLVPPTDQFRTDYTFLSPETYELNMVNVIHRVGASITLDDVLLSETPADRLLLNSEPIGATEWVLTTIEVQPGAHFIGSAESGEKFGIMVYAYDQYVSYSFPGGLDLAKH